MWHTRYTCCVYRVFEELPGSDTGERHTLFHLITVLKVPILFIDFLYLSQNRILKLKKKINSAIQHAP